MKIFKHIIVSGILIVSLTIINSCSEDKMDEIDTNPNNPSDVPSYLLIAHSTLTATFEVAGTDLAWYASVFVEHTTGVHGQLETADKRTGINSTIANNNWNGLYATTLKDLDIIIKKGSEGGSEEGSWASVGIAKVLMAYCYSVATDLFGAVPFTEALQGIENRTPAFDDQQTVYQGIFNLLDEAIEDLGKESLTNPGASDFFYQGDVDAWIKAAYGFKARFYNRLSNVGTSADTDSALAAAAKSFESAGDDMVFTSFEDKSTGEHPWYQEVNDRGHHAVSQTMDDILTGLNDPRRDIWFGTIEGEIVPAPNGTAVTDQGGTIYSKASEDYLLPTSPLPILTYDEIKFIEAEAYLRRGDAANAYQSYLAGIRAAMERTDIDTASISAYLSQSNVDVGSGNLTLSNIITQKYIAFWLFQPIEAYNDYRRTGIPTMTNTVSEPPSRFPYPNDEVAANPNVPDISYKEKVWWAIK